MIRSGSIWLIDLNTEQVTIHAKGSLCPVSVNTVDVHLDVYQAKMMMNFVLHRQNQELLWKIASEAIHL